MNSQESMVKLANRLYMSGDYLDAKKIYLQAQEAYPMLSFLNNSIARCENRLKDIGVGSARAHNFNIKYSSSNISIYRVIGNSIGDLHGPEQAIESLLFQCENEIKSSYVKKFWLLNRLFDSGLSEKIKIILKKNNFEFYEIPFDRDLFNILEKTVSVSLDDVKDLSLTERLRYLSAKSACLNTYLMNNNGARNFALAQGRSSGRWTLPFDGNIFINQCNFKKLLSFSGKINGFEKVYSCPMFRCENNDLEVLETIDEGGEEPQLMFGFTSCLNFDERFVYGRRPKVELFWRLGMPGVWDRYEDDNFDPPRNKVLLNEYYGGDAFNVIRLFSSGDRDSIISPKKRNILRAEGQVRNFAKLSTSFREKAKLICPELIL